jgi:hypothetical protein
MTQQKADKEDHMQDGVAAENVSTFRLYSMRTVYLLTFVGLGYSVWPEIIDHGKLWDPVKGAAFSFWAAYSALMGVGVRYPLKMLPLLILQLFYKSVWLLAVGLPLRSAGQIDPVAAGMIGVFATAVVLDLIVIPWPYVVANYVKKPGERWRWTSDAAGSATAHGLS